MAGAGCGGVGYGVVGEEGEEEGGCPAGAEDEDGDGGWGDGGGGRGRGWGGEGGELCHWFLGGGGIGGGI